VKVGYRTEQPTTTKFSIANFHYVNRPTNSKFVLTTNTSEAPTNSHGALLHSKRHRFSRHLCLYVLFWRRVRPNSIKVCYSWWCVDISLFFSWSSASIDYSTGIRVAVSLILHNSYFKAVCVGELWADTAFLRLDCLHVSCYHFWF
jgi:hypothetical protein